MQEHRARPDLAGLRRRVPGCRRLRPRRPRRGQGEGVWGIGVDADQAYVNQRVLTSAQKKVDVAVYTAIANLQKGKFAGCSNLLFNAANGGVGLGIINKAVPTSIRLKTKAIALLVAHGGIKPPTAVLAEPELLIGC